MPSRYWLADETDYYTCAVCEQPVFLCVSWVWDRPWFYCKHCNYSLNL